MATVKAQVTYEAKKFQDVCQNIKNDIDNHDIFIKELRRSLERGKGLYIQCTKLENHISEILEKIKMKEVEIQTTVNLLSSPNVKISDVEKNISKLYDDIRIPNDEKYKKLRRFTLLREYVSIKLIIIVNQLEECLSSKTSYGKFEIASYGLCALLSVSDAIKN